MKKMMLLAGVCCLLAACQSNFLVTKCLRLTFFYYIGSPIKSNRLFGAMGSVHNGLSNTF